MGLGTPWEESQVHRLRLGIVVLLTMILALAACSSGKKGTSQSNASLKPASSDRLNLKGVCPDPIVVQTDWDPESEYGVYYYLLGPDYKIDKGHKRVSGSLVAEGQNTGVHIEVRAGGPSIGFQPVTSQMYQDQHITLGQVDTDESIRFSAKQPTLAGAAPPAINPVP